MMILTALVLLAIGIGGFGVYWYVVFRRVLPLERGMALSRGHADDLKLFSMEILGGDSRGPASVPKGPNEIGQRTLSALHKLAPELPLWWITRGPSGAGRLMDHRGGGWALRQPESLPLDEAPFIEACERGGLTLDLERLNGEGGFFFKALRERRIRRVRLIPWGQTDGISGLLAVADLDSSGRGLERMAPFLDVAKTLACSLAGVIDKLVAQSQAQAHLQGGLSSALESLADTQDRLVHRTRQIKSLQDVAGTLSASASQTQGTLSAIVSITARALNADTVAFLLLDDTCGELVVQPGSFGLESDKMLYRIKLTDPSASSARVFRSGESFLTGDAQHDSQVITHYAKLWRIHSLMVVPLKIDGRSLGVIRVGRFAPQAFTKEHLEFVTVIAREAAVIVETAILNKKLAETAEQLTALNRMKDEFVSTVSHEFKTPLTTIMGFLTVILEGETGILSDQQGKFLGIAMGAAKRLSELVADLLDLSRLESGIQMEIKPRALGGILERVLETHRRSAQQAGKTLDADIPEKLPLVYCDDRWIATVLDNLLSNAMKFTRPGGRVALTASDKGQFLMVEVSDDGIGIPAQDKDRMFEKFYRASNRQEVNAPGTGLGLAIAREVISKHDGKIWYESSPSSGTRFYFIIKTVPRGEEEKA